MQHNVRDQKFQNYNSKILTVSEIVWNSRWTIDYSKKSSITIKLCQTKIYLGFALGFVELCDNHVFYFNLNFDSATVNTNNSFLVPHQYSQTQHLRTEMTSYHICRRTVMLAHYMKKYIVVCITTNWHRANVVKITTESKLPGMKTSNWLWMKTELPLIVPVVI